MRDRLSVRAERLARSAQRRRLEEVAAAVRAQGVLAEIAVNSVVIRGRALARRWLSDPLLRFAGKLQG